MIIEKLKLHNFGVYAGDNEFNFRGEKPIVLIGGMNGRGKTTFLEAVLLALYGSNSFAFRESKIKSYSQYLKSFINKNSSEMECYVELKFETNDPNREEYIVKRSWNAFSKKVEEEIRVSKDGAYNEFLTNNWSMFVENILPSALSSFFFFDGEKIAEMAVDTTNSQLKNAIRSMLGITVLDVLRSDISRSLKKTKIVSEDRSAEELQRLRQVKDQLNIELEKADSKLESNRAKLVADTEELDKLHQMYSSKGGDAVEKRKELMQKRALLRSELQNLETKLYELASAELPLLLVNDLIRNIKLEATDEHDNLVMKEAIMKLDELMDSFLAGYKGEPQAGKDFLDYIKSSLTDENTEERYALSDQALYQINSLIESILQNTKRQTIEIQTKIKNIKKQLGEIESYLNLDINEKELKAVYEKIKKAERKLIEDKVKISELEQKRTRISSSLTNATTEFNKYVEAYLALEEQEDKEQRKFRYSNIAFDIINKYQAALQSRKTSVLADTITSCYKKLANKRNLINRVEMCPETLDIRYLAEDNSEVDKNSLSAGEQQLLVISILWALAICSKKKLPVIIDTPLSRLDSLHRTALIQTYFPYAGEQTIILSTDSEIDSTYYQMMKENIGDEYTLNYDEASKSTSIVEGYLIGA